MLVDSKVNQRQTNGKFCLLSLSLLVSGRWPSASQSPISFCCQWQLATMQLIILNNLIKISLNVANISNIYAVLRADINILWYFGKNVKFHAFSS